MLRPLRIVRSGKTEESGKALEAIRKAQLAKGTSPLLVSVALRYQGCGLSLAELVAAGEDGWQRAQRNFGGPRSSSSGGAFSGCRRAYLLALYAAKKEREPQK